MNDQEVLTGLGFSSNEARVYLALVQRGPSLVASIAQDTGLNRPSVYKALRGLLARGIVSETPRGKRMFYAPEPPEKLRTVFTSFQSEFQMMLPELQAAYESRGKRPVVRFWDGPQGFSALIQDAIQSMSRGDTYYHYYPKRFIQYTQEHAELDTFRHLRETKGIQRYVITDDREYARTQKSLNRFVKVVPEDMQVLDERITQGIYGDKVALGNIEDETGVIIESKPLADLQRNVFLTLFKSLPR